MKKINMKKIDLKFMILLIIQNQFHHKEPHVVDTGITELDRENLDFPPYLISHGQKIGSTRILLATSFGSSHLRACDIASLKRAMWTQH